MINVSPSPSLEFSWEARIIRRSDAGWLTRSAKDSDQKLKKKKLDTGGVTVYVLHIYAGRLPPETCGDRLMGHHLEIGWVSRYRRELVPGEVPGSLLATKGRFAGDRTVPAERHL